MKILRPFLPSLTPSLYSSVLQAYSHHIFQKISSILAGGEGESRKKRLVFDRGWELRTECEEEELGVVKRSRLSNPKNNILQLYSFVVTLIKSYQLPLVCFNPLVETIINNGGLKHEHYCLYVLLFYF